MFGPRQTGKTTELLKIFPDALFVDLLQLGLSRELENKPEALIEMIQHYFSKKPPCPIIVIDEVQKVPRILDVVQSQIFHFERQGVDVRFVLTVSSRRRLMHAGASEATIAAWFKILEETLIGHLVPCFQKTHRRKAMSSSKFYFFDCGLTNAILNRFSLFEATPEFGTAFENYMFQNLGTYCACTPEFNRKIFYWRSTDHEEVDFIVTADGHPEWAIEVKSGLKQKERDFSGLNAFSEEYPNVRKILVNRNSVSKLRIDGIEILPVEEFLTELGT